jgi:hypothetical protein
VSGKPWKEAGRSHLAAAARVEVVVLDRHALPGREPQSLGPSVARAGQTVGQNSPHGCRYPNIAITGMKVIHNGTCGIGVRDARDHSISGSIERLSWELPAGIQRARTCGCRAIQTKRMQYNHRYNGWSAFLQLVREAATPAPYRAAISTDPGR